jgi:hypothetical protein
MFRYKDRRWISFGMEGSKMTRRTPREQWFDTESDCYLKIPPLDHSNRPEVRASVDASSIGGVEVPAAPTSSKVEYCADRALASNALCGVESVTVDFSDLRSLGADKFARFAAYKVVKEVIEHGDGTLISENHMKVRVALVPTPRDDPTSQSQHVPESSGDCDIGEIVV